MTSQVSIVPPLPKELAEKVANYWLLFCQAIEQSHVVVLNELTPEQVNLIKLMLGLSDFMAEQLCRHPHWLKPILSLPVNKLVDRKQYLQEVNSELADVDDIENAKRRLRLYRNQKMLYLAWQDFSNAASVETSLLDLSALAESIVIGARDWIYKQMCQKYGTPMDSEGNPQPLLVLAMGKLGGRELNFSSDIDLIFTFPEHGETQGVKRPLENQQFFIRMVQKLISLLDQVTQDGFVYRVDMRLRPYGESGPLVVSFSALEDYYQEQGRDWERYAMVKARALGPWTKHCDELHSLLRPFVYRRYIDFSAIDALRKMKQLIVSEVRRRKLTNNIKLGAGGIREVEFVVQSFQLIRGGREPSLRQQSLLTVFDVLQKLSLIDANISSDLKKSYLFLRRIENILQAIDDEQTQTLPNDPLNWQRLCLVLDKTDDVSLLHDIQQAMRIVHRHFCATVGDDDQQEPSEHWTVQLWHEYHDTEAQNLLASHGILHEKLWPVLVNWRQHTAKKTIGPRGRDTLDKLLPRLLEELFQRQLPCDAFEPVLAVLDQILTRTTYLELLYENLYARQQLIRLCYASPWIAKELARFPMLLDDLIDPKQLYNTTSIEDYPSELHQYLLRIPTSDMEQQMEALRQFKLSQQLKIAAADVTGVLPVMKVSDHLTYLAQAIIAKVVLLAWQQVTIKYGHPDHLLDDQLGFAVIGYGKLGGIELGYGSDLDLVFLHNAPANGNTNGDKSIGSGHFYLKLAQRILHLFSTRTLSGELYDVDMRLRPSGASGLLVSEIENFHDYQQHEAWTWEHQALVRARCIFGDDKLAERFNHIRTQVLSSPRDQDELALQVANMRKKMRSHLLKPKAGFIDLKQGVGGIADIEFLVQYLVLAFSDQYKELVVYSDNVRILQALSKRGVLTNKQAQALSAAYCLLRDKSNSLVLLEQPAELVENEIQGTCDVVVTIYQQFLKDV